MDKFEKLTFTIKNIPLSKFYNDKSKKKTEKLKKLQENVINDYAIYLCNYSCLNLIGLQHSRAI